MVSVLLFPSFREHPNPSKVPPSDLSVIRPPSLRDNASLHVLHVRQGVGCAAPRGSCAKKGASCVDSCRPGRGGRGRFLHSYGRLGHLIAPLSSSAVRAPDAHHHGPSTVMHSWGRKSSVAPTAPRPSTSSGPGVSTRSSPATSRIASLQALGICLARPPGNRLGVDAWNSGSPLRVGGGLHSLYTWGGVKPMTGHQKNSDDGGTASVGEGKEKRAPFGAPPRKRSFLHRAPTVNVSTRAPAPRRACLAEPYSSSGSSFSSASENTGPSTHTYLGPTLQRPQIPMPHFMRFSRVV